jgi:hypothetical protein
MKLKSKLEESFGSREFDEKLRRLGIDAPSSTVRRWSHENLLTAPTGSTRRTKWPRCAVGEAALIHQLRSGNPLGVASKLGIDVTLTLVRGLVSGERSWDSLWKSDEIVVNGVSWRPRRSPMLDTFLVDGAVAYFKALFDVPLSEPRHVRLEWSSDDGTEVYLEAEHIDADGNGVGDSISMPPSPSMIRAIQRARLPKEVR